MIREALQVARVLEPDEVEVRNPTIVVSVRLDEGLAKDVSRLARRKGQRISDVLRDAATAYVDQAARESAPRYEVESGPVSFVVGVRQWATSNPKLERPASVPVSATGPALTRTASKQTQHGTVARLASTRSTTAGGKHRS